MKTHNLKKKINNSLRKRTGVYQSVKNQKDYINTDVLTEERLHDIIETFFKEIPERHIQVTEEEQKELLKMVKEPEKFNWSVEEKYSLKINPEKRFFNT